jgi:hypothetical protein
MFPGSWKDIEPIDYITETRKRTGVLWLGHTYNQQISFLIGDNIAASLNLEISRFGPEFLNDIFRITMTRARTCVIKSPTEWMDFINSCYSLDIAGDEIKRKKGWRAMNGEKQSFKVWMDQDNIRNKAVDDKYDPTIRNYFRYNLREATRDDCVITVFDEIKQKRLLVDGINRSAALTMACEEDLKRDIDTVRIFECYGSHVDVIFPCDIPQLPS